jgi:hypothetical protein
MMRPPVFASACVAAALVLVAGAAIQRSAGQTSGPNWPQLATELRPAESFTDISDTQARSVALFEEAGKVLQHPRCMNCHPVGDRPRQTDQRRLHQPLVVRGKDGHGAAGMACATCHGGANFDPSRVPGDPHWALAPASMTWEGKTLGEICVQLKDPRRNGGRDIAAILKHMVSDSLVLWAWQPGPGRAPAPGTNAEFGKLLTGWAETGAHCRAR